jgi:hypothetical protein
MQNIARGQRIEVRDAFGNLLLRRALGPVDEGHDFPVVWAVREEEWEAAQVDEREPEATPWPAEDVRALTGPPVTG